MSRLLQRICGYGRGESMSDSLADEFEAHIAQLPPDVRTSERALITLGREMARRFDQGYNPAGSAVRLVLADLRRQTDRWERLRMPPAPVSEPERSPLDELRERRKRRADGGTG